MSAQIIPFPVRTNRGKDAEPQPKQGGLSQDGRDDLDARFHQFLVKRDIVKKPSKAVRPVPSRAVERHPNRDLGDELFHDFLLAMGIIREDSR